MEVEHGGKLLGYNGPFFDNELLGFFLGVSLFSAKTKTHTFSEHTIIS
jgi:hypothetical protein